MKIHLALLALLTTTWSALTQRLRGGHEEDTERGDVPGWVMITMMSALLVAALIAIAVPALTDMFQRAMSKVQ